MPFIILHSPCLAISVRILESVGHTVPLEVDGTEIAQGKWTIEGGVSNRAPEVDYLIPLGKEGRDFRGWKVTVDAGYRRCGRLVDMDGRYWCAGIGSVVLTIRKVAADRYMLNESRN